ncbi:MAG: response regulator [Rhodobacter sp.]|nr:response regulator [Rhodobacter sp.]
MPQPRVLIVEDDNISRYMLTEMCDKLGYAFETAETGVICIEKLQHEPERFGAILMDLHMPQLSGLDAVAEIRGAGVDPLNGMPIIAITADESWHDRADCEAAGFDNVLAKPISLANLQRVLGRVT